MKEYIAAAKSLIAVSTTTEDECSAVDYHKLELAVKAEYDKLDSDLQELIDVSTYAVISEVVA